MNKVPHITLAFWIMKICATTLGETAGDMVSMTLDVGYALSSIILIGLFLAALGAQLRAKAFNPWLYWTVILATSTAGTTMSDFMDRTVGLGYAEGSTLLIAVLAIILTVWRVSVGTLAVDDIRSLKVEAFYWTAILVSNTLGTALGDFLADSSGLGFAGGALLIGTIIAAITVLHLTTRINGTLLFWAAFVLTRPLGATVGDLLTKVPEKGGLGFGTIGSSLILGAVLVSLVAWSTRRSSTANGALPLEAAE